MLGYVGCHFALFGCMQQRQDSLQPFACPHAAAFELTKEVPCSIGKAAVHASLLGVSLCQIRHVGAGGYDVLLNWLAARRFVRMRRYGDALLACQRNLLPC